MNSPRRTDPLQASRVFDVSTPILELPAEHVAVLHGRGTAGTVSVATLDPGWSERAIPVEDLPRYLDSLPVGLNVYLSQARFRGWRRTQLLSSLNAIWLDIDHYNHGHRWSDAEALTALLRACDEGEPAVPAPLHRRMTPSRATAHSCRLAIVRLSRISCACWSNEGESGVRDDRTAVHWARRRTTWPTCSAIMNSEPGGNGQALYGYSIIGV